MHARQELQLKLDELNLGVLLERWPEVVGDTEAR
jgi:hypothetical protein